MAGVEPEECDHGHRHVRDQVVAIQEADDGDVAFDEILQAGFAEHAQRTLEADHLAGVSQGLVDVVGRDEVAPVLVDEQQGDHERELPAERGAEARVPPPVQAATTRAVSGAPGLTLVMPRISRYRGHATVCTPASW